MGDVRFYNSLTKQLEDFAPGDPNEVRVYHCGPTVYKRQHVGNMRRFLFADFLHRSLLFLGYGLREVTNITDVGHLTQDDIDEGEDKLAEEARAQATTPKDIADRETEQFFADAKDLNMLPSDEYPRATGYIDEMQELIAQLIEKEHAYVTTTGVYFAVETFAAYGSLSGNTLEALDAGSRVEVRAEKRHPADFALWVFDEEALQKWDSPWGTGYPGWHIECSAMGMHLLGETIDIHTGGEDNRFPHHENEIAQSEGVSGVSFARLWMHNAHLQLEGKKLAKREGEQITLDTIREKGFSPLAFRLLVFGSHYRNKMDFSWELMAQAEEKLGDISTMLRRLSERVERPDEMPGENSEDIVGRFKEALANDLNTPEALAVFYEYMTRVNSLLDGEVDEEGARGVWGALLQMDQVLGLVEPLLLIFDDQPEIPQEVLDLVAAREEARNDGDYEESDRLRDEIVAAGYRVEDTDAGARVVRK